MGPPLSGDLGGYDYGEQLPQSLSASAPATSIPSDMNASRASSLGFRRRSTSGTVTEQTDARAPMGEKPIKSLGGTSYIRNGKRYKVKEGPLIEDLLAPNRRVCFPYWPSYVSAIVFLAFWTGFVAIGAMAFMQGQPSKLTHPTDMFGFSCGELNEWNGITVDLRGKELLYWLDPFELTNPRNRWFAKGICVSSCPSPLDICRTADVPCLGGNQYRCPYYALAQDGLYGSLPYNEAWGTQYFDALAGTTQSTCWATQQAIPEAFDSQEAAFMHDGSAGAQRCGEFYQLTSQFPGMGPCYAVWSYSTIYLQHCVPIFPPDVEGALAAHKKAHPNDTRTSDPLVQPMSGWDVGFYVLDIINGWELILFSGLVAPTLLAVVVMLLMQKRPGLVIWLGIVCCVASILADTLLSFAKAGKLGTMAVGGEFKADVPEGANSTDHARKLWVVIGSFLAFASAALIVLAILLRRHIRLVVNLIRAASKVVSERPLTLLIPVVPLLLYTAMAFFWVWSTIYLFTISDIKPVYRSSLDSITTWWSPNSTLPVRAYELLNLTSHVATPAVAAGHPLGTRPYADPTLACAYDPDCYLGLAFDAPLQRLFTYNYFGFWLANEFITTITGVCIAFYSSHHYFILSDGSRPRPIGFWNAVACTWLSLPPLMVGTITNAVVDWFVVLRPICAMLDRSIARKPAQAQGRCRRVLCAPLRGLGYAASKLMKYSDRNGYYCGALYNKTYWQGCRIARKLADGSEERLAGAFESAGSVLLMCKGAVAGLSILMALVWSMTKQYSDALDFPDTYLSNALLPVFFCILSSYFVAELWGQVYEASLAVLLLGYCEDCRIHQGKPTLSPRRLIETLEAAAAEQAAGGAGEKALGQGPRANAAFYDMEQLPQELAEPRRQGMEPGQNSGNPFGSPF